MIHVIGDSHARHCFKNISDPQVSIHWIGEITLKRVGNPKDELIPQRIAEMNLQKGDYIIFVFGEIDIRCYVKPTVEHRKTVTIDSLLKSWVNDYISKISSLNLNGAKVIINSVVPPSTIEQADSLRWVVGGTDEERVTYTKVINKYLKEESEKLGWGFLDVYSQYADEKGMLPSGESDGTVHLKDTKKVNRILKELINYQYPSKIFRENIPQEKLDLLPKFMIIGAAKCGTTSLCDNLEQNPLLFLSSLKEPRFFCGGRYNRGLDWYLSLWKNAPTNGVRFESSTLTIFTPCHERIKNLLPDIKAIVLLRNPVKRAWSHYIPFYSQPPHNYPLSTLMNPNSIVIRRGVYLYQIQKWHEYFPKENLLIIRSEDYFADEVDTLKAVYKFIGMDFYLPKEISKRDPWLALKQKIGYPPIPKDIEDWLYKFYKPHNEALENYLQKKFDWDKEV